MRPIRIIKSLCFGGEEIKTGDLSVTELFPLGIHLESFFRNRLAFPSPNRYYLHSAGL